MEDDKATQNKDESHDRKKEDNVHVLVCVASLLSYPLDTLYAFDAPAPTYASIFISLLPPLPAPLDSRPPNHATNKNIRPSR